MWCKTYTQHTLAYDGIFLSLSPAHQIAKPLPERNTCPATGARSELAAFCQGWILPLFCIRHKQGFCLGKKKKRHQRRGEREQKLQVLLPRWQRHLDPRGGPAQSPMQSGRKTKATDYNQFWGLYVATAHNFLPKSCQLLQWQR